MISGRTNPLRLLALLVALIVASHVGGVQTEAALAVEELIEKKLPEGDDWETEQLHDAAKHQLHVLDEWLVDAEQRSGDSLPHVFTEGAVVSDLRPIEQAKSYAIGPHQVKRITGLPSEQENSTNLKGALADLMEAFGSSGGQKISWKALQVTAPDQNDQFITTMFYHSYGDAGSGFIEQHAVWDIVWQIDGDPKHPLISKVTVREFSETAAPTQLLVDQSVNVLGGLPSWSAFLQQGAAYWHNRIDTLGGVTFLGHNGMAVGDVNGDGRDDVFVSTGVSFPNLLLIQQPDGSVRDIAADAGVDFLDATRGALIVDIDNDGDQDLVLAVGARMLVLSNDGETRFTLTASLRPPDESDFYSLSAVDFDSDGDLDIYATRYVIGRYGVTIPLPWHDANNGPSNHLFRNDGNHQFTDVTREVGLDVNNRKFSLAAGWSDFDDDGDPDLYVANDFGRNNLYRNDDGKFVDIAGAAGVEDQAAGMGVSWADFDRDGKLDLHVGNMFSSAGMRIAYQNRFKETADENTRREFQAHAAGNALFRNRGDGTFEHRSDQAGIRMGRWSWGAQFADLNLDGYPDILSPNGFITNHELDDL